VKSIVFVLGVNVARGVSCRSGEDFGVLLFAEEIVSRQYVHPLSAIHLVSFHMYCIEILT